MKSILTVIILCLATIACASTDQNTKDSESKHVIGAKQGPAAIVDAHLAAYNDHDLDGMLKFFHPEIEAFNYPGNLQLQGIEAFRQAFSNTFTAKPHEVVIERIIQGKHVIDQVDTTFHVGDRVITERDTVIYTIEDNLIRRLTFL